VSEDVRLARKSGGTFWGRLDSAPLFDASGRATLLFITLVDVSDRVTAVDRLADSRARFEAQLSERTAALEVELERTEMLSRELSHRTKNALAILAAVIASKGRRASSRHEADLLADIAGRVRAIGGLQGLLDGVKSEENGVALSDLLAQLVADLDRPSDTRVVLREAPRAVLPADAALCVALCVTELVLNAQKHGLRNGQDGMVTIAGGIEAGRVTVVVEDSGDGLPEGFDPAASEGLGMMIVLDQAARLGGTFACGRSAEGGARFEIAFPA
jgi:two-component sensor histidine kinase